MRLCTHIGESVVQVSNGHLVHLAIVRSQMHLIHRLVIFFIYVVHILFLWHQWIRIQDMPVYAGHSTYGHNLRRALFRPEMVILTTLPMSDPKPICPMGSL